MAKSDPSDYILEQLHGPSVDQTRVENSAAWKSALSVDQYVERETVLNRAKMTSSAVNRVLVFGLKSISDPGKVLCSIELLVRESWKYSKNGDGSVSRSSVLSGCIGGVFTMPENRGRGLATIMVDKLMEIARGPAVLDRDGFVFLYSEVGEYYARNGFRSFHVPLINIPLKPKSTKYEKPADVELVRYHEFGKLFEKYNAHVDEDLRQKVAADGLERFTVNATSDYVDWFHLRLKYVASKLYGDSHVKLDLSRDSYEDIVEKFHAVEPHYYGMKVMCPETGVMLGFIAWHYEYDYDSEAQRRKNYVTILKIYVDRLRASYEKVAFYLVSQVKEYFEAAQDTPQLSGFEKILLWQSEVTDGVRNKLCDAYSSTDGLKNSSLGAICGLDPTDDAKLKNGQLIWEDNTKLPWF